MSLFQMCGADGQMIDKREFYIDGAFVAPLSAQTLEVIDPATEEPCAVITLGSRGDAERAIAAAQRAFPSWSKTTLAERACRCWRNCSKS